MLRRKLDLKLSSKKGNAVLEVLLIVIVIFSISLLIRFISPIFSEFNDDIQNDTDMSPLAKSRIAGVHERFAPVFDNGIVAILMFLWIGALISSFFTDTHPVFFIVIFILLLIVFYVSAILGNTYEDIISDGAEMEADNVNFTLSTFIFTHLMETMIFMGFTIAIALFAKFRIG